MITWGSKLGYDLKFGFLWILIVVGVLIGEAKCQTQYKQDISCAGSECSATNPDGTIEVCNSMGCYHYTPGPCKVSRYNCNALSRDLGKGNSVPADQLKQCVDKGWGRGLEKNFAKAGLK